MLKKILPVLLITSLVGVVIFTVWKNHTLNKQLTQLYQERTEMAFVKNTEEEQKFGGPYYNPTSVVTYNLTSVTTTNLYVSGTGRIATLTSTNFTTTNATSTNLYVSALTNLAGALTFTTASGTTITSTNAFFTTLNVSGNSTFVTATFSGSVGIGSSTPAANLTVVNGTISTTVSIGNPGVGKLCQWNGSEWTISYFPSGSTTANITTSTSCN